MKIYGANKSTEFTKKQISVIFAMAKRGELRVEKFIMQDLYNLADYYGYDDNHNVEESEQKILEILENVFAKNIEIAQKLIDDYTNITFNGLSAKYQKTADRNYI